MMEIILKKNYSITGKKCRIRYLRKSFSLMLLIVFCALSLSQSVNAQSTQVSGKVTDAGTGEALVGVTIVVKGTTNGTITDVNGNYTLELPSPGTALIFSFIGYDNKEVVPTGVVLDVQLEIKSESLDEVVVVGYGSTKKRDLTGAVSSVKADEIEDQPFSSLDQALQGKVSGVTITPNSGAPGGGISVRVRGITSLTGSNEPLYIIDGVPIDGGQNNESFNFGNIGGGSGQTRVSALSSINPSDIESIEILKDASALAIYGSRASNGVIIITTKNGNREKATVAYEGYYGVQEVSKYVDMMDLRQYAEYVNEARATGGLQPTQRFLYPELLGSGTDWQKEIFRTAPIQNHQLSVSGGTDKTKIYTSLNYFNQDGIVIRSNYDRLALRLNLDFNVNSWFNFGNTLTASSSNQRIPLNDAASGVVALALRQSPDVPVRMSDGSWGGPSTGVGPTNAANPVAWANIRSATLRTSNVLGNLYGEINFLKDFKLRNEIGYNFYLGRRASFNPIYQMGNLVNDNGASYKVNSNSFYWILKNYLTYTKDIGKHSVTALAGHEAQQSKYEQISAQRAGFLTNEVTALQVGNANQASGSSQQNTWSMESYFARLNYSFNDRYLITATYRADASSNFGPNNKWGYFPSFSAAWVASEEPFMEPIKGVLSWFKLRAGYGEVGNQNITPYAYGQSLRAITTVYGTAFSPSNIANPDVKWESTTSTNLGVELGFLQSRIRLDADFYIKKSKDFLYRLPMADYYGALSVPDQTGFQAPFVNLGEMENRGVDLSLNTINIKDAGGFSWTSNLVFSTYKNKLTELADENAAIFQIIEFSQTITKTAVGGPVGRFYGYQTDGIFQTVEEIQNAPVQGDGTIDETNGTWIGDIKFKDISGPDGTPDGIVDDYDRTYIGNPHPDFTFSFTNQLSYKNFDLNVSLFGSYGNDIYNYNRVNYEGMGDIYGNPSVDVANRFREGINTNTDIPRFVFGDPNNNVRISDRFIEDGSFLRIQNVTLGYTLPASILGKTKVVSNMRAYFTAQNLYTFTKYKGYDPLIGTETNGTGNNALLMGIDNGRYPVARTYMLGLSLTF